MALETGSCCQPAPTLHCQAPCNTARYSASVATSLCPYLSYWTGSSIVNDMHVHHDDTSSSDVDCTARTQPDHALVHQTHTTCHTIWCTKAAVAMKACN